MIVIYEPQDMTERSRTKPATERTLSDVDPRALASPTIYIATDGVARLVKGTKSTDEEFEIQIERLK